MTHPDVASLGDWTHPDNYEPCCVFADEVRAEGCEAIRYRSVRDPQNGMNLAVLTCRAFAQPNPIAMQTWHIFLTRARMILTNESLHQHHEYLIAETAFVLSDST